MIKLAKNILKEIYKHIPNELESYEIELTEDTKGTLYLKNAPKKPFIVPIKKSDFDFLKDEQDFEKINQLPDLMFFLLKSF